MKSLLLTLFLIGPAAFFGQSPINTVQSLNSNNTSAVRQIGSSEEVGNVSKLPIRSLLYPDATTKILVRYMGWFGSPKHKDIGYRSDDPEQVRRQVEDMISRGIDGAIVAWYGPDNELINRSTQLLFAEAKRHPGFSVAVSIDTGAFDQCDKQHCDVTEEMSRLLGYVEKNFETSPAYLRVNGRPLVTSFGLEKREIDWARVRAAARNNPLFVFRNSGGFKQQESDGAFSWVAPETVSASDPMATAYLNRFNAAGLSSGGKLIIASAYKGFDDSAASWGKGKRIAENCGETWLDTFDVINRAYSTRNQLPFLLIPTWNDYEEGTDIEPGIENCVSIKAELHGTKLEWKLNGSPKTIDHYTIYASADGRSLTPLVDVNAQSDDYDLKRARVPAGTRQIYLQAVGKPSMRNHLVGPIGWEKVE